MINYKDLQDYLGKEIYVYDGNCDDLAKGALMANEKGEFYLYYNTYRKGSISGVIGNYYQHLDRCLLTKDSVIFEDYKEALEFLLVLVTDKLDNNEAELDRYRKICDELDERRKGIIKVLTFHIKSQRLEESR